jgi:hypothetical protein
MPYEIIKQKDKKFKVCKADDSKVCFSKKGIPLKTAKRQIRAIVSSEKKKGGARLGEKSQDWWLDRYSDFEDIAIKLGVNKDELYPMGIFMGKFEAEFNSVEREGRLRIIYYDISSEIAQQNYDDFNNDNDDEKNKERKKMFKNQRGMEAAEEETKEYNSEKEKMDRMTKLYDEYKQAEKENRHIITYETLDDFIEEYERLKEDTNYTSDSELLKLIINPYEYTDDDTITAILDGKDLYEEIENLSPNFYMISGEGKKSPNINTVNHSLMYLKHFLLNKFEGKTNEKDPATGIYKKGTETITSLWIDYNETKNFGGEYNKQQVDDWEDNLYNIIDIRNIETILYDPDNWLINRFYKNQVIKECKMLSEKANQMDSGIYWCENMCSGKKLGSRNFGIATEGLVALNFYKDGNNIVFSGMDNSEWFYGDKIVYIHTKCSSRYGFISFNALRQIAQNDGEGDLCYLPELKSMDLTSLGYYSTVMFYWQQGAYGNNYENNEITKDDIYKFLDRNFEKDTFEKALNVLLDELEDVRGCSEIKDKLFSKLGLGGHKYFLLDKSEEEYLYKRDVEINKLKSQDPKTNVLYSESKDIEIGGDYYTNKNPELMLREVIKQVYDELPNENIDSENFSEEEKILYNKMLISLKQTNKVLKEKNQTLLPIPTRKVFLDVLNEFNNQYPDLTPKTDDLVDTLYKMTKPSKQLQAKKAILKLAKKLKKENKTMADIPVKQKKTNRYGHGVKGTKFYEELKRYGINPPNYLKQMKKWAKASGYDDKQLDYANDDVHKLRLMTEQGTKRFGRVGYKDYYIYRHLEKKNEVKKGYAKIMRDRFRKSHGAITKKRKLGRNSANELSIRILWHEEDDDKEKK